MLHPYFQKQLPEVISLLKKHNVKSVYAFGSVVSDKFNESSDIDLLINFIDGLDPLVKGQSIWDLEDELKLLLKREVDLITESSLKNPYFIKELNETKLCIYE